MRKFSVTVSNVDHTDHYLVEAPYQEEAIRLLDALTPNRPYSIRSWGAHVDSDWRAAWDRGEVKVLRARALPEGIE